MNVLDGLHAIVEYMKEMKSLELKKQEIEQDEKNLDKLSEDAKTPEEFDAAFQAFSNITVKKLETLVTQLNVIKGQKQSMENLAAGNIEDQEKIKTTLEDMDKTITLIEEKITRTKLRLKIFNTKKGA